MKRNHECPQERDETLSERGWHFDVSRLASGRLPVALLRGHLDDPAGQCPPWSAPSAEGRRDASHPQPSMATAKPVEHGFYVDLRKTDGGDLEIVLNANGRAEFASIEEIRTKLVVVFCGVSQEGHARREHLRRSATRGPSVDGESGYRVLVRVVGEPGAGDLEGFASLACSTSSTGEAPRYGAAPSQPSGAIASGRLARHRPARSPRVESGSRSSSSTAPRGARGLLLRVVSGARRSVGRRRAAGTGVGQASSDRGFRVRRVVAFLDHIAGGSQVVGVAWRIVDTEKRHRPIMGCQPSGC